MSDLEHFQPFLKKLVVRSSGAAELEKSGSISSAKNAIKRTKDSAEVADTIKIFLESLFVLDGEVAELFGMILDNLKQTFPWVEGIIFFGSSANGGITLRKISNTLEEGDLDIALLRNKPIITDQEIGEVEQFLQETIENYLAVGFLNLPPDMRVDLNNGLISSHMCLDELNYLKILNARKNKPDLLSPYLMPMVLAENIPDQKKLLFKYLKTLDEKELQQALNQIWKSVKTMHKLQKKYFHRSAVKNNSTMNNFFVNFKQESEIVFKNWLLSQIEK